MQAEAARGIGRHLGELVSRIKTTHAQLYYLEQNERLTREILDLMARLEKVAQVRYGGGLAAQQDVIRAQLEQTTMRNELIALDAERSQLQARLKRSWGALPARRWLRRKHSHPLPAPETMRFDVLEQRARSSNPLLRTEESQIQAAEKNRELTYRTAIRTLRWGVTISTTSRSGNGS